MLPPHPIPEPAMKDTLGASVLSQNLPFFFKLEECVGGFDDINPVVAFGR
jgi:hypothetical protein